MYPRMQGVLEIVHFANREYLNLSNRFCPLITTMDIYKIIARNEKNSRIPRLVDLRDIEPRYIGRDRDRDDRQFLTMPGMRRRILRTLPRDTPQAQLAISRGRFRTRGAKRAPPCWFIIRRKFIIRGRPFVRGGRVRGIRARTRRGDNDIPSLVYSLVHEDKGKICRAINSGNQFDLRSTAAAAAAAAFWNTPFEPTDVEWRELI